jgi:hypothetical protein
MAVKLEVGDPSGFGCCVTAAPAGVAAARTTLTSPPPGALQYLVHVSRWLSWMVDGNTNVSPPS